MALLGVIDYFSFYVSMMVTLLRLARAGAHRCLTDPPMVSLLAGPIAWLKVAAS
jgi:hypothetical protein